MIGEKAQDLTNVVFTNKFLTILWNDIRLDILDSDGKYFMYCFYIEELGENTTIDIEVEKWINTFKNLNNCDLIQHLKFSFPFDVERTVLNPNLQELYKKYGKEFVNRFGEYAVIIRE